MRPPAAKTAASRSAHPSTLRPRAASARRVPRSKRQVIIPTDRNQVELEIAGRAVKLTNLRKLFWPKRCLTKGDLLQYYADVSGVLLPHLINRAMPMKRYT